MMIGHEDKIENYNM